MLFSMDGFKVVRIEEVVGQVDILITATGKPFVMTLTTDLTELSYLIANSCYCHAHIYLRAIRARLLSAGHFT